MKTLAMLLLVMTSFTVMSQDLDLSEDLVRLESGLIQQPDEDAPNPILHYIEINTQAKTIVVVSKSTNQELLNLSYSSVYTGQSRSVSLRQGETMFMLNDPTYMIATYSQLESTFSFIDQQNNILLLGQIYYIEEEYRK